jgi:eight-cysteine-cluster-containing protein
MSRTPEHRRGVALCAAAVLALAAGACDKPKPPPGDSATSPADDGGPVTVRQRAVPVDHPLFDRFEGTGFDNACQSDSQCRTGGCGGEVCSAAADVITTCEVLPVSLPEGTACGCVEDQCLWWNADGATLPPLEPEPPASCATVLCEPPKVCLEYFGIAGPRGPKFVSCEIRCDPSESAAASAKAQSGCPEGTSCVTIADGPGSVCR